MNVGKHTWLMENVFFLGADNASILSVNRDDVRKEASVVCVPVFNRSDVAPEHFNLLRAAPMLYQQLTYQYGLLQAVIDALDANPNGAALARDLTQAQNSILLTQRAAIEGIEKIADELDRTEPPPCPR